ncbi:MAG: hypothetical protein ACNA7G_08065 [Methylobacter sp.]
MKYLLIAGFILFSAACSVTDKRPALHDFGVPVSANEQQGRAWVSVNAPTWLWDNRIRYRLLFAAPSQVRFYGLDRWIAAPPELFEQLLNVGGKASDYNVIIRLQDFEQQFDAPDRARVVLRFSAEAYSGNDKVGTQAFYLQQPTKTPDAAGAIGGFTELARQAGEKIQRWLMGIH